MTQVLQEYYTSADGKGFHVKATSPDITPDMQSAIDRMVDYRVPSSLDPRTLETHPTALRYWYNVRRPEQSILLCSQSAASDETNRAGNIFAHSLVMAPTTFSEIPPIFYWHSPLWQREDPVHRARVDSLPILDANELETLDIESSIEDMWTFLAAQGERRHWLYKLLSAVVLYPRTKRRILILDTIENVSQWIKLVTLLLPPDYRPLLSFSTYSHTIAESPYLITGTTRDWFRDTDREYGTYFVLNALQGRLSQVDDSFYAQEAVALAASETYFDLLKLLTDCTLRFSPPQALDLQLDTRMYYAKIQQGKTDSKLNEAELQAIHLALEAFDRLSSFTKNDIDELKRLKMALEVATEYQSSQSLREDYEHVCFLLKRNELEEAQPARDTPAEPEEPPLLPQVEPAFAQNPPAIVAEEVHNVYLSPQAQDAIAEVLPSPPPSEEDLQNNISLREVGSSMLNNIALGASTVLAKLEGKVEVDRDENQPIPAAPVKPQVAVEAQIQEKLQEFMLQFEPGETQDTSEARFHQLSQQYNDSALTAQVNQAAFIAYLLKFRDFPKNSHYAYSLYFWEYLGRFLKPSQESWPILLFSLIEVHRLDQRADEEEKSDNLFETIIASMTDCKVEWLKLVVSFKRNFNADMPDMVRRFYEKCIETLPLDQRPPFRDIIQSEFEDILELLGDELERDLEQARKKQKLVLGYSVLENWVQHLKQQDYDKQTIEALKDTGIHTLKDKCNSQQWRELARPLLRSEILAPLSEGVEQEVVRVVLPSLSLARFESKDVPFCKKYKASELFREDTRTTLSTIDAMQDFRLLDAALVQRIQHQVRLLLPNEYVPGVQRFITEFFKQEITPTAHTFMLQAFFTRNFQHNQAFWKAYHEAWLNLFLNSATTDKAVNLLDYWFDESSVPLLRSPYILQEFFLTLPDAVIRSRAKDDASFRKAVPKLRRFFWYPLVQEYFSERPNSNPIGQMRNFVYQLFRRNAESQQSVDQLTNVKLEEYPAFFDDYWKFFADTILSNTEEALRRFSFWFGTSFESLGSTNLLSRKFFLGLDSVLKGVRNAHGYSTIAEEIHNRVAESRPNYPWYPVVEKYFTEVQE